MDSLEEALKKLPANATMRDIFDFCVQNNLHNLAQGMIELAPPRKLRELVAKSCLEHEDIHQYRNRFGEEVYRNALAKLLQEYYGAKLVTKDNILGTSGVSGAIFSTHLMLKNEKAPNQVRIGLLYPFYTYHLRQIMELHGKPPTFVATNEDFTPNWEAIENALKGGLDLLMFCNPGNPQGNVWPKEDIERLVKLTADAKCLLLIDEIYSDLVWRGEFYSPINEKIHEHVIVCRGFSKTLGAQSWRLAYMVSHPSLIAKVMRVHDPVYISLSWQQHALADYLTENFDDYKNHVHATSVLMQDNWKKLSAAFQKALGWEPIQPDGSMYGMFKHHVKSDREAVLAGLKKGVGVAPGNIFWPDTPDNTGYVRIHCGISAEKADEIVKRLLN